MLIRALLPDIHPRPTGGNLFNRRVLAYLDGVARVERRVVAEGEPLPRSRADLSVIDSLLLAATAEWETGAAGRRLLIAHYLRLFEPDLRDSAPAASERRLAARLDGVITTSRFCRDVLIAEGLSPRRVAAITPGRAPAYFTDPPERPAGVPRLLTVATVLEGKGLRSLLGVLETLDDLDWSWELAGDPGLDPGFSAGFRGRLAASPIASRVRLLGAVDPERMIEVYDRATLFVLPSRFETCSIATMEAMARGLPVIACRVGGIPERVPAATAELLAPPGDPRRLGAVLRRLLEQPAEAAALGRENRAAGRAFPSWDDCGAAVWSFLQRVASNGR